MGLMDTGTDTATGTEWAIGICTCDTHICQPARYTMPMSNTRGDRQVLQVWGHHLTFTPTEQS